MGANAYRLGNQPCPIEFPPTHEIRINNTQLNASTKGLKKKPGTAPPPDIGKLVNMSPGINNRIDLVYVHSHQNSNQQSSTPKVTYIAQSSMTYSRRF
jgi:E3 SUMO-protein ligase PIAS1